jgi:LPXTG-motif cell wall-anchored protein
MMHGGGGSMDMGNWNWALILIGIIIGFLFGYLIARRRR